MAVGLAWEWLSRTTAFMTTQQQYSTGRTCGGLPGAPLEQVVVSLLPASQHHPSLTQPGLLWKASVSLLWHLHSQRTGQVWLALLLMDWLGLQGQRI